MLGFLNLKQWQPPNKSLFKRIRKTLMRNQGPRIRYKSLQEAVLQRNLKAESSLKNLKKIMMRIKVMKSLNLKFKMLKRRII